MKDRELLDVIDDLTLKMVTALQEEKFDELEVLYERRRILMKDLMNSKGKLPEVQLSKLARDSEKLKKIMKEKMERAKEKVEEISRNLEILMKYGVKDENSQIDERR